MLNRFFNQILPVNWKPRKDGFVKIAGNSNR